jgi:AcrR family transcriptional regulator
VTTRDRIRDAAFAEFVAKGEAGFRVSAVAKVAGCATSVLYHYYVSRSGLIDAAMMEAVMRLAPSAAATVSDSKENAVNSPDFRTWLETEKVKALGPDRIRDEMLISHVRGAAKDSAIIEGLAHIDAARDAGRLEVVAVLRQRGWLRDDLDDVIVLRALEGLGSRWRQAHFADDEVEHFVRALSPA